MTLRTLKENKAKAMQEGGAILARIRSELVEAARPGTTLLSLDALAEKSIREEGGKPSFKFVPGYSHATCINLNDGVVHGIPSQRKIQDGDLVKIDVGLYYHGFHTDTAQTTIAGTKTAENERFLVVGKKALKEAIEKAVSGNHVGHISEAIQRRVEGEGYTCIRSLTGHGVGKKLHEDPPVPCFLKGPITRTPLLKEGQTLAIEVIYAMGTQKLQLKEDGWTLVTEDGAKAGLFEETVMITKGKPIVLTKEAQ